LYERERESGRGEGSRRVDETGKHGTGERHNVDEGRKTIAF
jgi:hypothetical protein